MCTHRMVGLYHFVQTTLDGRRVTIMFTCVNKTCWSAGNHFVVQKFHRMVVYQNILCQQKRSATRRLTRSERKTARTPGVPPVLRAGQPMVQFESHQTLPHGGIHQFHFFSKHHIPSQMLLDLWSPRSPGSSSVYKYKSKTSRDLSSS